MKALKYSVYFILGLFCLANLYIALDDSSYPLLSLMFFAWMCLPYVFLAACIHKSQSLPVVILFACLGLLFAIGCMWAMVDTLYNSMDAQAGIAVFIFPAWLGFLYFITSLFLFWLDRKLSKSKGESPA